MSITHALLVTSPLWLLLAAGSFWVERHYLTRWVSWRLRRPIVNGADYPEFKRQLALWKSRKPVKGSRQSA